MRRIFSQSNAVAVSKSYFILLVVLTTVNYSALAQSDCPKSENKKAIGFFQDASDLFEDRKYTDSWGKVEKAIDADPEFADAYLLQGKIARKKKDDRVMEESYKKVIELCPDLEPDVYYQLGWLYFDLKKWKESEQHLKKFLDFDKINEENGLKAENMLARSKIYAHPVPFNPVPVKDISTADPEYLPYISPDNTMAFFTRRYDMKSKAMLTPQSVEKFMIAKLQSNGMYDHGVPMPVPFNSGSSNNEGGAAITIDNKHLFFTVNTKGNFDICTSDLTESGSWTDIVNLGPKVNDPKQWDSQPTISSDSKTIYFASSRDSATGIDIYRTTKDENGEWKKAVRLGSNINTNGNDKCPFLHSDSKTLYFSSDSLPGLGGFDIYKCQMDSAGKWGKPVNLGYPINTDADEVGFFVSLDGKTGYFASNKLSKASGGYDIFSFELYPEARPNRVYFQKGDVNGPENDEIPATSIEIKDAVTKKLTKIDVDSVTGEYSFVTEFEHDLIVSIKQDGFAFESKYVSQKDSSNYKPKEVYLTMKRLEVGVQYTINDILFTTNSFELNDTIKTVLDEFIDYLSKNPKLRVALQGHTDNVGNPDDNMRLSESRAKAVSNYLVANAILETRITYKGYGETKPIADNNSEVGRAKNRRTVFVVTSK